MIIILIVVLVSLHMSKLFEFYSFIVCNLSFCEYAVKKESCKKRFKVEEMFLKYRRKSPQ